MTAWRVTDLSVSPPLWQMAAGDRETFQFDAGDVVVGVTAQVRDLGTGQLAGGPVANGQPANGVIAAVTLSGQIASVTVENLTTGSVYQLAVRFQRADGRRWTRTLILECVA